MEKKGLPPVISRQYRRSLIYRCSTVFVVGILFSSLVFYLFNLQSYGYSYQESFKIISLLKQELLVKSIIIYAVATVLIIAGIVVITLLYSHRIVGPMYRLKMFVKGIGGGDLSQTVVLRGTDEVKLLGDQFNRLIANYRKVIQDLSVGHEELTRLMAANGEGKQEGSGRNQPADLADRLKELEGLVEKIKL